MSLIRKINRFRKAQITSEYAILVTVIIGVLIAMQIYIKRGVVARLLDAIDYPLNAAATNFSTNQYEPNYYYSDSLTEQNFTTNETMAMGGGISVSSEMTLSSLITEIFTNGTQ